MAIGKKTGGRKKGSINKNRAELLAGIEAAGETPLDYMLRVMRDPKTDHERRDRMAAQVAPYVHARLASVEHSGSIARPHEDALNELDDGAGAGNTASAAGQLSEVRH